MTEAVSLTRYEAAAAALAEAVRVDEVQAVRSDALKMRAYAKIAKNKTMEADAATIILRAERKLGVLIQSAKDGGLLSQGGRKSNLTVMREKHAPDAGVETGSDAEPVSERFTLNEAGIDKKLSMRAQQRARLGDEDFIALLQQTRDRIESAGAAPINGSRNVMGSRQESVGSLDFFPTPPWATRALVEDVLPHLGAQLQGFEVEDPCCGEGHITGVLEEYGLGIAGYDIHDYSANGRSAPGWVGVRDFLGEDSATRPVWIISNTPFGDQALLCALRALERAEIGVALFVRTQWLDGIDRYEKLFFPTPPTLIAQFAERVNLCKGRWDPEGSTATPYCWLVWIKGVEPRAPFWIPPGRRDARSKPGDVERFTAHPVLPIRQDEPVEPAVEGPNTLDGRPATSADASTSTPPAAARALEVAPPANGAGSIADHDPKDASTGVAATPETGSGQSAALGAGEGGMAAALPDLPYSDIPADQLSKDQQNEIIRAGYARTPKTSITELMLATGLKRSTVKMRVIALGLADPENQKAAAQRLMADINARRAGAV